MPRWKEYSLKLPGITRELDDEQVRCPSKPVKAMTFPWALHLNICRCRGELHTPMDVHMWLPMLAGIAATRFSEHIPVPLQYPDCILRGRK